MQIKRETKEHTPSKKLPKVLRMKIENKWNSFHGNPEIEPFGPAKFQMT